ncbi:hypothetical protein GVN21_18650 [Caulobacter sp. SLTY]|uniref:hypothetical protein n=1 Tax=Caulobacter sp. SLTY TaxID=2683262 RepID=UPI0014135FE4|nr:hypothetical protein [Caulobacter sp. SLTY]NBB17387.1 hypothetical protein [Caulobacter sp. SLTY]
MRIAILAATAALATLPALGAVAAEPQVTVTYGAKLQDKIDEYGARDVDRLAEDLRESVLKRAAKTPALDDATIELVLEDVVPNRPTIQQMSDKPGLSYDSFGVGGASISGTVTTADGRTAPVSYRWYETDIRWAYPSSTWSDARQTFDRFALRLARNAAGAGN